MEFATAIQDQAAFFVEEQPKHRDNRELRSNSRLFRTKTGAAEITSLHIPGDGFAIWRTDYSFAEDAAISLHSDEPVLMLHFLFGATLRIAVNHVTYLVRDRQYNLGYFPTFHAATNVGKNTALHTVHIHFELPFLRRTVNGSKILTTFLKAVEGGNTAALSDLKHYPTQEMQSHIFDIFHNPYTGRNAGLFTSTQVNLLLLRALDSIAADRQRKGRISLTATDVQKLDGVREYLMAHITEPVTIGQLTRVAGMNADKLQKGFKQLFSATVIAYHTSLRLMEARRLLLETELSIAEIAYSLGYSSAAHFSDAFKKAFHSSPNGFRTHKK